MATPGTNDQKTAEDEEINDSNPVIENKTEQTGKGKKKKLLILVGALILLLAGGSFFAISFFKEDPEISEQAEGAPSPEGEKVSEENQKKVKATFALNPFLVNLADIEDVRFIKTTFKLGLAEEPKQEATDMDIAAIRDSIITLLTSKTSEQILTPQGKQLLRDQVRARMNELSLGFNVVEVYIIDFVVQL